MRKKYVQMSFEDIYNSVSESMESQKSELVAMLEKHIDLDELIPTSFRNAFYGRMGRDHIYHLYSFLWFVILKKLFGLSQNTQMLNILKCSSELRNLCGFSKIPDPSQITRFFQNYCDQIEEMFIHLVDITEPICREINSKKADYLIYDTTGIEAKVSENNPKFFNSKLKQAKKLVKDNSAYDPYKGVYDLLPKFYETNPELRQQYIDGHFCYAAKAGIITNGLGIVRHISFFDDGFSFKRAVIPLNIRNSKSSSSDFNSSGTPVCPLDGSEFQFLGKSGGKNRSLRFKWVCPKSVRVPKSSKRICICDTPCTDSSYGKCVYTYPDRNFRFYPGIPRNTEHWDNLYKHRVVIERTINLLKDTFALQDNRSHNTLTLKADLFLSGIVQLIGVILADKLHKPQFFKSVRKLMSAS